MSGLWYRISVYFGLRDALAESEVRKPAVVSEQAPAARPSDTQAHRVLVYWGVREDPELEAAWAATRVDARTELLGFPLGLGVIVLLCSAGTFVVRLVSGGDTDLGAVVWLGARLAWSLAILGGIVTALVRAGRWLARRSRRR